MSRTTKQPKTGGKRVSSHCQNNGQCNWCVDNRTIASQKQESAALLRLREVLETTPKHVLDEIWDRVQAMELPKGPTLQDLICQQRKQSQP